MAQYNAMEENFMEIVVFDKPALFTDIRIDKNSVPKELYFYEVRHDDEGCGDPVQIAKGIMVNYFGMIITHEPIQLHPNGYLDIEQKNWSYAGGDCRTVEEFIKKYSIGVKS